MINTLERRNLIFKIFMVLIIVLIVFSVTRVLFFEYNMTWSNFIYAFFKEMLLSIIATIIVLNLLYLMLKEDIKKLNTKAEKYAFTDSLTGLYNRHYLNNFLEKFALLRKDDVSFCVMFIDIDKFKKVNDSLGHATGDCILKILALKFKSLIRPNDILCRYGGEEFLIIFNNISKEDALEKAEQVRISISDNIFDCEQQSICISAGLSFGSKDDDINKVIQESDKALYMAKEAGRNCVKVFPA
ncbi:MAG: GGDEF domain-containing protein [Sulfurimonas sp.]|nr:MAG: GGDEF domain-containing protein [Sulfurimonas sp.]